MWIEIFKPQMDQIKWKYVSKLNSAYLVLTKGCPNILLMWRYWSDKFQKELFKDAAIQNEL